MLHLGATGKWTLPYLPFASMLKHGCFSRSIAPPSPPEGGVEESVCIVLSFNIAFIFRCLIVNNHLCLAPFFRLFRFLQLGGQALSLPLGGGLVGATYIYIQLQNCPA